MDTAYADRMPTVLLVRHGRTTANASGVLAGWTPGVGLDETGRKQAATLAEQLSVLPLSAAVSSPLQRCLETAAELVSVVGPPGPRGGRPRPRPRVEVDERLGECRYGDWTGRKLADLVQDPLWRVVQGHPSGMVFPGPEGESMVDMQHRAVSAVREHDARVGARFGDDAIWLAVSHADVIKSVLADALGMHLDAFQRLVVDPCSVSVVRYTPLRPFAVRVNGNGTDLAALAPGPRKRRKLPPAGESDAVVGGGDRGPKWATAAAGRVGAPAGGRTS